MVRIDAHVHVFAKISAEFPREASSMCPTESEAPVEKLLARMESHGTDQAVLVQIGGDSIEQHAYLRHCLKSHPGRFLGIGHIPSLDPDPATHMDHLAADGDIIGFGLFDLGAPSAPAAPADVRDLPVYLVWRHAAERDYVLWLYPRAGRSEGREMIPDRRERCVSGRRRPAEGWTPESWKLCARSSR
jgi:hypothetical protein